MTDPNKPRRTRKPKPSSPSKRLFDIEEAAPLLRDATAAYPKAALFELYAEGHTTVFEILVACIVSIRTRIDRLFTPHIDVFRFAAKVTDWDTGR